MKMARPSQRGPYAKGEQKRGEILDKAVEAFGKYGYHATSMREVAAACGLSQAGLLHYFPNKEALLLALVDRRESEQYGAETSDPETWLNFLLSREAVNEEGRALTQLWANLVSESTDPDFPTHQYFVDRYVKARESFAMHFAQLSGRENPVDEDHVRAALLTAVWDGLQTQWLLDPKFEMRRHFEYALVMLSRYSQFK
jgi:AcrR family transcriptional regulator